MKDSEQSICSIVEGQWDRTREGSITTSETRSQFTELSIRRIMLENRTDWSSAPSIVYRKSPVIPILRSPYKLRQLSRLRFS